MLKSLIILSQALVIWMFFLPGQLPISALHQQSTTGTPYPPPQATTTFVPTAPRVSASPSPSMEMTQPTGENTPTTTLQPLPDITLIFPAATSSPTTTNTPNSFKNQLSSTPDALDESLDIPPRYRILAIVLIILWLLIAGYMAIYLYQVL